MSKNMEKVTIGGPTDHLLSASHAESRGSCAYRADISKSSRSFSMFSPRVKHYVRSIARGYGQPAERQYESRMKDQVNNAETIFRTLLAFAATISLLRSWYSVTIPASHTFLRR